MVRVMLRGCVVGALGLVLASGSLVGCGEVRTENGARLYDGFGNYGRAVTTDSRAAQRWFDQGMQLMYGFNHDEAVRSFEMAALEDPDCAMAHWAIAYCQGININDPAMTDERSARGREACDTALGLLDDETAVEKALVHALSARYEYPAPEDRKHLDEAYAAAMGEVHKAYPGDDDVAALYAESLMNLQPWDYWTSDGSPRGRIGEIVGVLEGVLARNPRHPGANHFYIHAVEASADPDRAVEAADRLTGLVPGSGHLVHMPSHIYVRVGRYEDAAASNERAIAADRAYFEKAPAPGFYSLYAAHNVHFLAFASMMKGDYGTALRAARALESSTPEANLRELAGLIEGIMPTQLHVMIRFGKWEAILEEPDYPEWRVMSRATWSYARSIACSALGRTAQAREEMAEFERRVALVPEEWYVLNNRVHDVLPIARAMMRGELLYREGKHDEAFAALREGIAWEDSLVYDEPPAWMLPVRHALGALLMGAGRASEAEAVYREDLSRNRGNGWALTGLRASLVAQGRSEEARMLDREIGRAFASADTSVTSSCFCEP